MGRDRAVESEGQWNDLRQKGFLQKDLPSVNRGVRYGTPFSIPRSGHSQASSPSVQQVTLAVLAYQLNQLQQLPVWMSRSVIRYPYVWLGATWTVLILVGGVAAVTLLRIDPAQIDPAQINAAEPEPSIAVPLPEQFVSARSQHQEQQALSKDELSQRPPDQLGASHRNQKSSLPLFALGTVAFSCAIGCLLLSYRLTSRQPESQSKLPTQQRLPRSSTPTLTQGTSRNVGPTAKQVRSSSSDAFTEATVALVSPDESHPLDWNEPSLADHLDIRQHRPLSHWL